MTIIKTIDLWTEYPKNPYEVINGAFVDGFSDGKIPFDSYKLVKNCNCIIETNNENINITNKHHAIIWYKDGVAVRLLVIGLEIDIDKCIDIALSQSFKDGIVRDLYDKYNIKMHTVDMKEEPIYNKSDRTKEIDVGSCDRWNLLYSMLKGSYTEDKTTYGNYDSDKYEFIPDLYIRYYLKTDEEILEIIHKCGFINNIRTRLIPIQEESLLTK